MSEHSILLDYYSIKKLQILNANDSDFNTFKKQYTKPGIW